MKGTMRFTRCLTTALIALSAACSTVTEHMSPDPDLSTPHADGSFLHGDDRSNTPLPAKWWTLFNDATLDDLMERLNTANPDASA